MRMFESYIWSSDLAYVIGLITTDGNLSKDGRHIIFTSKDLDQVQNFAKILELESRIGSKKGSYSITNRYYFIQFSNVRLYKFLLCIGLCPNKSKILKEILIPDQYFVDFLRGCFDGDGYSYSYWDKRWKNCFRFYVGFVSASKIYLDWTRNKINDLYNIPGRIKYNNKSAYYLIFAKRSSLTLVQKLYYNNEIVCLSRKRFKLEQALSIINKQAEVEKLVYSLP